MVEFCSHHKAQFVEHFKAKLTTLISLIMQNYNKAIVSDEKTEKSSVGLAYQNLIKTEKRVSVLNPEEDDDERTIMQSVKRQRIEAFNSDDSSEV